jgi:hypothetical protein
MPILDLGRVGIVAIRVYIVAIRVYIVAIRVNIVAIRVYLWESKYCCNKSIPLGEYILLQ